MRPVGERLDLCLQYIARVKKQVARAEDHDRAASEVHSQMGEKLANGLRDLEVLRAGSTCPGMELETNEEISKLRAHVAELQMERQSVQNEEGQDIGRDFHRSIATASRSQCPQPI